MFSPSHVSEAVNKPVAKGRRHNLLEEPEAYLPYKAAGCQDRGKKCDGVETAAAKKQGGGSLTYEAQATKKGQSNTRRQ